MLDWITCRGWAGQGGRCCGGGWRFAYPPYGLLAEQQRNRLGEVIPALARQALWPSAAARDRRTSILLLPVRCDVVPVAADLVRQLCDELP